MAKRIFSFSHKDFKIGKDVHMQKYLRTHYNLPVTIEEFMAEVAKFPKLELHNSKYRSPSYLNRKYKRLVQHYGFFPGGQPEGVYDAKD